MTRPVRAIAVQKQAASRLVTLFALLAFFLQGLAVQTHIHQAAPPVAVKTTLSHIPAPAPLKGQDPTDQGCRLCHELVHSGAFVTPVASTVPASLTFVHVLFAALPLAASALAPAFGWQSRAPPRV